MSYILSDIFIGRFDRTQGFGDRPQFYSARFGLRGHNGQDYGCPSLTPILSASDGWVSEKGFDVAGYGNYIKVVHDGYLTLYAHLNDIQVSLKERVIAGQLLGHSDNTGLSDGPHLHFGVAPCDANGIKTEASNGFSGYIDPSGGRCEWRLKNPNAPVTQSVNDEPPIAVSSMEFKKLVAKSTSFDIIVSRSTTYGLNEYLQSQNIGIVDLQNNPNDPDAGNKVVTYMGHLIQERKDLESRISQLQPSSSSEHFPEEIKANLLEKVWDAIKQFSLKEPHA